jgi:hypothetical protein
VIEVKQRHTRIKADPAEEDVPLALVADAELFRLRRSCAKREEP